MSADRTSWPHAPEHRLSESGHFMVTCGTFRKEHHFRGRERLGVLHRGLLKVAANYNWTLQSWSVFSNHYHFVGHSPTNDAGATSLADLLSMLHSKTAGWVNRLDGTPGRKVWHNFWETRLTHPRSYFARLNYVHQNPVRHRLVSVANQYPWCSARWFEQTAPAATVKTIYQFKTERLQILDDYEPESDW
jgi:putative transposase